LLQAYCLWRIIADLHRQYRQLSAPELRALAVDAHGQARVSQASMRVRPHPA
jgi:hypothetical protein